MAKDYIPRANDKFATFQQNIANGVNKNATAWGIPSEAVAALSESSEKYNGYYRKLTNKAFRTKVDVKKYNNFRVEYEKQLRQFVNEYLRGNSKITTSAKSALLIKVFEKGRQQRSQIMDGIMIITRPIGGLMMEIKCRVPSKEGRASIPPEADGLEICYSVGTKPEHAGQTTHFRFSARAAFILHLPEGSKGKTVYFFARWVNQINPELSAGWSHMVEQTVY